MTRVVRTTGATPRGDAPQGASSSRTSATPPKPSRRSPSLGARGRVALDAAGRARDRRPLDARRRDLRRRPAAADGYELRPPPPRRPARRRVTLIALSGYGREQDKQAAADAGSTTTS
jgi:hypothetical protein